MGKALSACAAMIFLSLPACVQTNEVQLSPNVVRLDTQASGVLFSGKAGEATLKRAAELTLRNGYTHFRFANASTSQSREFAGVFSSANGNVSPDYAGGANFEASGYSTPVYRPVSNVGVTVVMLRSTDPAAKDAFDAKQILSP